MLIGLKRKGLSRERIHALRAGFRFIFNDGGHLYERAGEAAERWKDIPEMGEIAAFILEEAKRPICTARRRAVNDDEGD